MKRLSGIWVGTVLLLAAAPIARADEFPAGPAHDIVAKACTQCHAADLVTSSRKTREGWADTVTTMMGNGAQVTDTEYDKVVAYLAKNFPAK